MKQETIKGLRKARRSYPTPKTKVETPKTVYDRKTGKLLPAGWDEPGWEEEYNKNWMYPPPCWENNEKGNLGK